MVKQVKQRTMGARALAAALLLGALGVALQSPPRCLRSRALQAPCRRSRARLLATNAAITTDAPPPSTATLARFALPTLGAWLVSPLMSLVDTAVVGRSASALELAALGPGTMVGDSLAYFCSFLSVATTNMIATARAENGDPAPIFGTAVRLAVLCGLASACAQIAGGRWVLTRYTAAESAAVVQPAYEYVRARACGAPFALLIKVSIASRLAAKDAATPLVAVAGAGVLNLAGDLLCVPAFGVAGAAWATVASEAACACFLLRRSRLPGGAARRLLPSRADVARFAVFAKPLLVTLAGKIATYSSLAHVATAAGVASTAAHRVLMCVYWFFWRVLRRPMFLKQQL